MAVKDLIDRLAGNAIGKEQQDFLRECSRLDPVRSERYALAQRYYDGEHNTKLVDRAKLILESNGIKYAENYCDVVIDTMTHRMNVTGFSCAEDAGAEEWAKTFWTLPANRVGEFQGVVHTNTTIKGDGFVAVEYDNALGRSRMSWNRPEICAPHYADGSDEMEYLVKCWETRRSSPTNPNGRPIRRMNVYFPDRVEKYFAVAQGDTANWTPHMDAEDASWPIWWTDTQQQDGTPLGIPFAHFRNKADGNTFGTSEIRGAIPLQDAINKQLVDLFYVMDTQGWPVRWGTGIPDDQAITLAIGEIIKATDSSARFGQFEPADPRALCEAIEASLRRFAVKTATPVGDLIASTAASGESKKTDIEKHIAKVKDREQAHGAAWSQAISIAYKLDQVFGSAEGSDEAPQFVTLWTDPQPRNESDETDMYATQVREIGLSKATALARLGYDADAEMKASAEESENAARRFNAGVADTGQNPYS